MSPPPLVSPHSQRTETKAHCTDDRRVAREKCNKMSGSRKRKGKKRTATNGNSRFQEQYIVCIYIIYIYIY